MNLKANLLAFARSIQVSEGLISAVRQTHDGDEIVAPVEVVEKTVRGQISNAPKKSKEFHFEKPNPQTIDYAMMPPGFERLRIEFTTMSEPIKPAARFGQPRGGASLRKDGQDLCRARRLPAPRRTLPLELRQRALGLAQPLLRARCARDPGNSAHKPWCSNPYSLSRDRILASPRWAKP